MILETVFKGSNEVPHWVTSLREIFIRKQPHCTNQLDRTKKNNGVGYPKSVITFTHKVSRAALSLERHSLSYAIARLHNTFKDPANNTQLQLKKLKPDEDDDDDEYFMGGTYKIRYNLNILDNSYSYSISDNTSKTAKSNKQSTVKRKVHVPRRVAKAIQLFLDNHGWNGGSHEMVGYTSLKTMLDGRKETFRATDEFHGSSWYDWCMVEWTIGEDQ